MTALRHGVAKDGVVVPELVRQMRAAVAGKAAEKVHFGATSQDVIDTSLMLRLKMATEIIAARLGRLIDALGDIAARDGHNALTGYTRMQAAIGITVADRAASWIAPLERHLLRLETFAQSGFALQFGGAAGTLEKLGDNAGAVRADLAMRLGLADKQQWQSQRDGIAEFGNILARDRDAGQVRAGYRADGRDRYGNPSIRRRRFFRHAAQAESGQCRNAGSACPL